METKQESWVGRKLRTVVKAGALMAFTAAGSIFVYDRLQEEPHASDRVVIDTISSTILGQKRELIVHLPEFPDSGKTYPVVYVLDGSSQDDHIANTFDVLAGAGIVSKTIVVGIPNMSGENRSLQLIPPFMKTDDARPESPMGTGDTFLRFMKEELIPFVERRYPASETRLFAGHSRGALLVMYSLMYDPEMFAARFCFSGPYWRQDSILVSNMSAFLKTKETLKTFLYLSVGSEEGEKGFGRMSETIRESSPGGFDLFAEVTPHADHQNNAQMSASRAIARWGRYSGNRE